MKKSSFIVSAFSGLVFLLAASATASAQDSTTPPPPPPPPSHPSSAGLGVGGAAFLSGLTGVQVVYDMRIWHAEGLFAFDSSDGGGPGGDNVNTFQFGVRGWYHLHVGTSSDFSLGGGAGIITRSGGGDSATATLIEPGMMARVFLTPNFALHATAGLSMVFGDSLGGPSNTGFRLSTQLMQSIGFTYFFR
jgi:hypothetical protein